MFKDIHKLSASLELLLGTGSLRCLQATLHQAQQPSVSYLHMHNIWHNLSFYRPRAPVLVQSTSA